MSLCAKKKHNKKFWSKKNFFNFQKLIKNNFLIFWKFSIFVSTCGLLVKVGADKNSVTSGPVPGSYPKNH